MLNDFSKLPRCSIDRCLEKVTPQQRHWLDLALCPNIGSQSVLDVDTEGPWTARAHDSRTVSYA